MEDISRRKEGSSLAWIVRAFCASFSPDSKSEFPAAATIFVADTC